MHELDKTALNATTEYVKSILCMEERGEDAAIIAHGVVTAYLAYLSSTSAGVTEEQTPRVTEALRCLEELANMPLGISLEDWGRLSSPILAALEASRVAPARVTDYWHSVDTAPEDEWVILATSGEHVGQALMLVDEDTGQQAWSWYGGDPVHPNLKPLGWRHMPSPLFTEILPDNRPGGFDGPTGAE